MGSLENLYSHPHQDENGRNIPVDCPPNTLQKSDEGSDGPFSTSNRNRNGDGDAGTNPNPRTPFPATCTANGTQETSSEDEQPAGGFKFVENDPFEVIRKSMLGPSPSVLHLAPVPSVPSAEASGETSPSKMAFPSVTAGAGQRTLMPDPGDVK